jgi:hypothetical protein
VGRVEISIVWSYDNDFTTIIGSVTDMYGNSGGVTGLVGNKITYFKALSYSDVGVIGVESNSVSFRKTSRHFRLRFTLSSIIINWEGSYSSIKADWGYIGLGDCKPCRVLPRTMVAEDLSIGVLISA